MTTTLHIAKVEARKPEELAADRKSRAAAYADPRPSGVHVPPAMRQEPAVLRMADEARRLGLAVM